VRSEIWANAKSDEILKLYKKLKYHGFEGRFFSEYDWNDVKRVFGLVERVVGDIIPCGLNVSQECVDNALMLWHMYNLGLKSFPGNNESEREEYVSGMILSLTKMPIWGKIGYVKRYQIKNAIIPGVLDYALVSSNVLAPVLCLTEAKDGNVTQGRAQVYVQLISCYELCETLYRSFVVEHGIPGYDKLPFHVYGVVSAVEEWIFVRFDGKMWLEASPMFIKDVSDREGLEVVLSTFHKILCYQDVCWKEVTQT
jgi:hypothetical protein